MPTTMKPSWDPAPIKYSIEAIRDRIRESLAYRGIPIDIQATVLGRYREADSVGSSEEPQSEARPESVRASPPTFWGHPYAKWGQQIIEGHLPPEWEEFHMRLPPPGDRKELRDVLRFSAKLDHLVNRVQRQLSEENLQDHSPEGVGQLLREALHLLSFFDVDDMFSGARQRMTNTKNARQPHRLAGILLFFCIMKKEGAEKLGEVVYHVGTKGYRDVNLDGQLFLFKNRYSRERIEVYEVTEDGEESVCSTNYQSSTLYEWRTEAWAMVQAGAAREAWEGDQKARDEEF